MKYDHDYYNEKNIIEYQYINYKKALEIHDVDYLKSKYQKRISNYLNRIKILTDHVVNNGAVPIFINQVLSGGLFEEELFIHNYSLIEYCRSKELHCIDISKKFNGKLDYWYDGVHTTALGSKVIAETIIDDLIKIIKKENLFSS